MMLALLNHPLVWLGGAGALLALLARSPGRSGGRRRRLTGPEVEPVRTWERGDAEGYVRMLAREYEAAGIPVGAVPLAAAHSAMATGAWLRDGPRVFNHNVGVVRAFPPYAGPYARLATREEVDGRLVTEHGAPFRAYDSYAESVRDTIALWSGRRYRPAYEMMLRGDPAWSRRLGELGYYTRDPAVFERAYRDRLRRVRAILAGEWTEGET